MRLVLYAPNVHQGGGLTLLKELIKVLPDDTCLIIDSRLSVKAEKLKRFDVHLIRPTISARLGAEWTLSQISSDADLLICFGNLPPLFPIKSSVTLFLQNRYIIDENAPLNDFTLKIKIRLKLERLWFKWRKKNVTKFVVQGKLMQNIVKEVLNLDARVLPFSPKCEVPLQKSGGDKKMPNLEFVYVSSGEPHKNHKRLVLAWVELSKCGLFPSLCLTVSNDSHSSLCDWIEAISSKYNLKITNMGVISHDEVLTLYQNAKALIFPSLLESFGLPLVESKEFGLPILASELDYVRDVVEPEETFDPTSPLSISRAVRRFLGNPELPLPILTAEQFLGELLNEE